MNKNLKYIIVPALAGIMFASCNNNPQGPTQAELDAQVETKVNDATVKMRADCDAQILQVAQMKKDSILIKTGKMKAPVANSNSPKSSSTPKSTTTTTTTTTTTEPVKEQPKGLKKLSDQAKKDEGKTGGLKDLSDQSKAQDNEAKGNKKGGLKSLSDKNK